jgi:Uma2 family endonuclease
MGAKVRSGATIEDLYTVPDNSKAEIVAGEIMLMSPTQWGPNIAGGRIFSSLDAYAEKEQNGYAFTDNMAFVVTVPTQRSFSPDAAYFLGEPEEGPEEFIRAAPTFAVEVRSDGDYGPAAERKMARKRAEYFAAGTLVVWDVDVLRERVVRVYRASEPDMATVYGEGEVAEAEPAVPGWRFQVDRILAKPRR